MPNKSTKTLFEHSRSYRPLADRVRPESWGNFQGIENIDPILIKNFENPNFIPPSMILWGPPGCGKTTFARLIEKSSSLPFIEFSAVLGGVKDVRKIVDEARYQSQPSILFVDEIHRFNKSQQDAFLPHVENGTIVLIGATTENPSFYLNSALLSRVRVLTFLDLNNEQLKRILDHACKDSSITINDQAEQQLIQYSGGDARKLLNICERIVQSANQKIIDSKLLEDLIQSEPELFYDRSGEEHYNLISAFIKSLRGSDPDAALYWGFRMIESGEDPRYVIRRMIIFASEDIGNADPRALTLATSTLSAFELLGLPEGRIPIAQCITYLATAPKSNRSYHAMNLVLDQIKRNPKTKVPMHLRNAPTKLMKDLEYGKNYQYPHNYDQAYVDGIQYLPDEVSTDKFYEPSGRGYEKTISERIEWLKSKAKNKPI